MRDRPFIIAGLLVGLAAVTYPSWRAVAAGGGTASPRLARSRGPGACVLPAEEMRASHMQILAAWRDGAVREGARRVTMRDGRTWKASLSGTCLGCHDRKAEFCDRCHDYAAVKPDCWNCHVVPAAAGSPGVEAPGPTAGLKARPTRRGGGG